VTDTIIVDRPDDGVVRITLNRPDRLNALTFRMTEEISAALDEASADRDCRAIVITGAGRGFCSGVDLKDNGTSRFREGRDAVEGGVEWAEHISGLFSSLRRLSRPVIAAVNGPAAGGGFALALLADIRIAGASAKLSNAFIRNGLSACELGTSYMLPRLVGVGRSMELLLTGRTVDATEADRIGLVNKVVPDGELQQAALEMAQSIAAHSPFAVAMTKQVATANLEAAGFEQALLLEMRTQALAVQTDDSKEARRSFLERRPPRYTGFRTR
jgi:enoyl-CoA hydratase